MKIYSKPEVEVTMFAAKESITDMHGGVSQGTVVSPF